MLNLAYDDFIITFLKGKKWPDTSQGKRYQSRGPYGSSGAAKEKDVCLISVNGVKTLYFIKISEVGV